MKVGRSVVSFLLCAVTALAGSASARVIYEPDTHFTLTYALMRLACFSHKEALIIASADAGMDSSSATSPGLDSDANRDWHALDVSKEAVLKRKQALWDRAMASKDLVQLGQYFHYQEDTFSHREGHGISEDWKPYGSHLGHAGDLHQPDRPPYDKERAKAMAKQKLAEAQAFVRALGRPQMQVPDDLVGFLIEYQCLPYTHNAFGLVNEVDPDDVAASLDNILQQWFKAGKIKKEIHCPKISEVIPYNFDDHGNVKNPEEVRQALAKVKDYNFPPGYQPEQPKTPDNPVTPPVPPTPQQPKTPDKPKEPEKPKVVEHVTPVKPEEPKHAEKKKPEFPLPGATKTTPENNQLPLIPGSTPYAPPVPPSQTSIGVTKTVTGDGPDGHYTIESKVTSSVELVDMGATRGGDIQWCFFDCYGHKHSNHGECDYSCDEPCDVIHGMSSMWAYFELNATAFYQLGTDLEKVWPGAGAPGPTQSIVSSSFADYIQQVTGYRVRLPKDHFAGPCSAAYRRFGYHEYKLRLHVSISTSGTRGGQSVNESKDATIDIGSIFQPDVSRPYKAANYVSCWCERDKYHALFDPKRTATGLTPYTGLQAFGGTDGPYNLPKLSFTGRDINVLDVEDFDDGVVIYFPGGETFIPDDPDYQEVVTLYGGLVNFDTFRSIPAANGPAVLGPHKAEVPIACLQMNKKQPDSHVHYTLAKQHDPVLRNLALVAEWENVHGPWDQARLWIYKDHATLEKVNNKLMLGVPPGRYMQALYEVMHDGGVDLTQPDYKGLLEPKLVWDAFGNRDSTIWFITTLALVDPDGLAKELTSGSAAWGAKLQDNDRDYPHAVNIIDAIGRCLAPQVRETLPLVIAALPDSARTRILAKTELGKARASLATK